MPADVTIDVSEDPQWRQDAVRLTLLRDILDERQRQIKQWGNQRHPDGTGSDQIIPGTGGVYRGSWEAYVRERCQRRDANGTVTWFDILLEEFAEVVACNDQRSLDKELNQLAAVCMAWREDIAQRSSKEPPHADPAG